MRIPPAGCDTQPASPSRVRRAADRRASAGDRRGPGRARVPSLAFTRQRASATTVPGPPSGWTTTYSDCFSGSAGSGVDSGWTYDTGTQYNGTGCTAN